MKRENERDDCMQFDKNWGRAVMLFLRFSKKKVYTSTTLTMQWNSGIKEKQNGVGGCVGS